MAKTREYISTCRCFLKVLVVILVGALILVISNLFGWHPVVRDPWIEIEVKQIDRQVEFEFFIYERTWWPNYTRRVPTEALAVTLGTAAGQLTWEVQTQEANHGTKQVVYGSVPAGFEQLVPKEGTPPKLVIGQEYQVWVHSGGSGMTTFVYKDPRSM